MTQSVKQYIFFSIFCSMCVQIFSWQCLLLPVLPSYSKYGAESEISERSAAIPHQKDRLWSRHEDQMHQGEGAELHKLTLCHNWLIDTSINQYQQGRFFSYLFLITLSMIGQQACPSNTFHGNFFVRSTDLLLSGQREPRLWFCCARCQSRRV